MVKSILKLRAYSFVVVCSFFVGAGFGCSVPTYKTTGTYWLSGRISSGDSGLVVYVSSVVLTRSGSIDPTAARENRFVTGDSGRFVARVYSERADGGDVNSPSAVFSRIEMVVERPGEALYLRTFGPSGLDSLKRIRFQDAGLVQGEHEFGVWVLPDIMLPKKDSAATAAPKE